MAAMLDWARDLDDALAQAAAARRFILADFTRPHCAGCTALHAALSTPPVAGFIRQHFIPVQFHLDRPPDQPQFQLHRVIWTPTLVFLDRRGVSHYSSPGFLPPPLLLDLLCIGLARTLLAWSRHTEAADHLQAVADQPASPLAAEALFWLGTTLYLRTRQHDATLPAWDRLRREHPHSVWAARVPPEAPGQIP